MPQKLTRQKKILCFAVYSVYFLPLKNTKDRKPTRVHFKRNRKYSLLSAYQPGYGSELQPAKMNRTDQFFFPSVVLLRVRRDFMCKVML